MAKTLTCLLDTLEESQLTLKSKTLRSSTWHWLTNQGFNSKRFLAAICRTAREKSWKSTKRILELLPDLKKWKLTKVSLLKSLSLVKRFSQRSSDLVHSKIQDLLPLKPKIILYLLGTFKALNQMMQEFKNTNQNSTRKP